MGLTESSYYLIENNFEIDSFGKYGYNPLHLALSLGNTKLAIFLIVCGANPNAADVDYHTPLHYAATYYAPRLVNTMPVWS